MRTRAGLALRVKHVACLRTVHRLAQLVRRLIEQRGAPDEDLLMHGKRLCEGQEAVGGSLRRRGLFPFTAAGLCLETMDGEVSPPVRAHRLTDC